ncbi:MAG: cache domain-containing protein, partial [Opitutales bacterium]|nr:cache domain-containing protein [Opitutales bacterium]
MRLFRRYGWAFWVCAILLAGFLVSSVSSYLVSRESVRQTITESALPLTSDNIYSEIQRDLLRPVFISSMMANDTFLKDWVLNGEKDPGQVTKYLREIMQKYETVTSFFVSERTRNYYHADLLLKQVKEDAPRDVWYFRVRDMDPVYEINVDRDLANRDEMTVFINYKVFDHEDGSFLGATGVGLTVSRVHQLINSYEERYGRHILFVDSDGNVMLDTASNTGQAERNLRNFEGIGPYSEAILSSQVLETRYRKNGKNYFVNSRFVPELRWYLIVEQSEDLLLSPLRETLIKNIAIAVFTTLIVSIICVTT